MFSKGRRLSTDEYYSELRCKESNWRQRRFFIWKDYAGNTTLHGPNHITSTTHFWRKYYTVIFIIMSVLFFSHTGFLIHQYLQFPINTDVKYQNIPYSYPDITVCPNSGTSEYLLNFSDPAKELYEATKSFWSKKFVNRESARKLTKRSFLKHFYQFSDKIGRLPHHHILWCQINGQSCLDQIIITEHPIYYRCFTLRPVTKSILAGPTHGITLLLHKGDPSKPLLQLNEHLFFEEQSSAGDAVIQRREGFIIGFHERGSFPNFQLTALPAALDVQLGEKVRISLDLTSYKAANLKIRPCAATENLPLIRLLKADVGTVSDAGRFLTFSYIRQSCIAIKRQELIFQRCGCFSEEYNIPAYMANYGNIWCCDVEGTTNKIVTIDATMQCVRNINMLTENDVLFNYIGTKSGNKFLETFNVCPLRCDRFIHLIHSIFKDQITHSINLTDFQNYFEYIKLNNLENVFLNSSSSISKDDFIVIDISAVFDHVNEVIETQAYDILTLISQIGGISGLYIGITMFTTFEIMDLIIQWTFHIVPIAVTWMRWKSNVAL